MTSQVDVTVPTTKIAFTRDLRTNFARIKQELEALQAVVFGSIPQNSPQWTGSALGEGLHLTGNEVIDGTLTIVGGLVNIPGITSVTYGTLWSLDGGNGVLLKAANNIVRMDLALLSGGAAGTPLMTMPAGFRPILDVVSAPVVMFDSSAAQYVAAHCTISASTGQVTVLGFGGALPVVANNDKFFFHLSYSTA